MEQVSPAGPIYQAGTLSGNPLAMAAVGRYGDIERPFQMNRRQAEHYRAWATRYHEAIQGDLEVVEGRSQEVMERSHAAIVASGGAGTPAHMTEAVTAGNADAVLAASIFHRDIHSIEAVKADMAAAGVPVRLGGGNA